MAGEPLRYPELPDELRSRNWKTLLRFFGPGAIIASVTIGSGETVFASRGGALFGYALLWCFVGGGIMKFVQVYTAARYMTLTGEHPIERWKYLPGPQGMDGLADGRNYHSLFPALVIGSAQNARRSHSLDFCSW